MKRLIIATVLAITIGMASTAFPADKIMTVTVDSVMESIGRNGAPYVRVLFPEKRTLQGVEYSVTVPLMFFGDLVDVGGRLEAGQIVRVIVNEREYRGNPSYTAIKVLDIK